MSLIAKSDGCHEWHLSAEIAPLSVFNNELGSSPFVSPANRALLDGVISKNPVTKARVQMFDNDSIRGQNIQPLRLNSLSVVEVSLMSKPPTVSFRRMRDGSVEDFQIIDANDELTAEQLADRIIEQLRLQADDDGAYQIDRLQHVLQTATRAELDGADDDWIAAALLHDLGDILAPHTHGEVAAEIVRPFLREQAVWVVKHHGLFQRYYYASLTESQRNYRDRFRSHPHYQAAVDFCERWDQCSFDPEYATQPLEHFEPVLRRVFSRTPFDASNGIGKC